MRPCSGGWPTAGKPLMHNRWMSELAWDTIVTPVGEVWVACSPHGVARVSIGRPSQDAPTSPWAHARGDGGTADSLARAHAVASVAVAELGEYFSGERRLFDVPVDWSATSGTQKQVLSVLHASVGYGQTITYGELAVRAGLSGTREAPPARTVGQVLGSNPCPVIVPCHRVVASNGLGGYSGGAGVETKRWLLALEGAIPATLDLKPPGRVAVT